MTSYKTYQKWKPFIDQYKQSTFGSMKDFCLDNNLSYSTFREILRNEKYGLIGPPSHTSRDCRKAFLPGSRNKRDQKTSFKKVVIFKEAEHESEF